MLPNETESSRGGSSSTPVFGRVMIAVDQSKTSTRAFKVGADLAAQLGATAIALVHVLDVTRGFSPELGIVDTRILDELRSAGVSLLDGCVHELRPAGETGRSAVPLTRFMPEGEPATEIVRAADEWGADVIILGAHARGPVARFLLGSTAETVVRRAHCPVLTVGHTRSEFAAHQTADDESRHPAHA
jgi:glycine betaine transporter